ncbi:hypothetical protein F9288_10850 [Sphingomonas sp. CL5.1]|uniref:hypothetical protein n=1 Tax=Sphingomonas sp. CL5.1 TaxID=2653203 RepID=UPI0015840750|nr:hypothetical protein [Sphingomonas sp. CL5.1]QKS00070.1 hypothetical protein F9288_10850 [Sphingomonas sp. CL5.1]
MGRFPTILSVAMMAAVIIGVDFAFLRHRFWARLAVNCVVVIAFGAIYLLFLRRP